jgi:hypothetical protein
LIGLKAGNVDGLAADTVEGSGYGPIEIDYRDRRRITEIDSV